MTFPAYYKTYPPFVPPIPQARALPGFGAAVAVAGAVLAATGLLAVHWVGGLRYTDIFTVVKHQPTPSGAKAHFLHLYFSGGAFAVVGVGVLVALLWCCGVMGREGAAWVAVGVVQALLMGIQAYAVYAYFDRHFHIAGAGVWLTLGGSIMLLAASLIGPRISRPWR